MPYYTIHIAQVSGTAPASIAETAAPPAGHQPFAEAATRLLPPQITTMHQQLAAWKTVGYTPGAVLPDRIWIGPSGELAWFFGPGARPQPMLNVGLRPTLAAWLFLLDQVMETYVVLARARSVWSPDELAGALPFLTPAYLPPALVQTAHGSWQHLARALALAVADGPLQGEPTNRHWQN